MKELVSKIKIRLKEQVKDLKTVEINWGQLSEEKPSMSFPCALIDLEKVEFSQRTNGCQLAEPEINILIADRRPDGILVNVDPLQLYALIEKVHANLQLFSNGEFAPLFRKSVVKAEGGKNFHGYKITYQTNYMVPYDNGMRKIPIEDVQIGFI